MSFQNSPQEIAKRCAEIQVNAYEHFGINSLPTADEELKEFRSWMADQLRKTSWFNLIDDNVIEYLEDEYNAHEIAFVISNMATIF